MARDSLTFEVPDWNFDDPKQDDIAIKVFTDVPKGSRKRKANDEDIKVGGITQDGDDDYYFEDLDPRERLKGLLNRLRKEKVKSETGSKSQKRRKKKKKKLKKLLEKEKSDNEMVKREEAVKLPEIGKKKLRNKDDKGERISGIETAKITKEYKSTDMLHHGQPEQNGSSNDEPELNFSKYPSQSNSIKIETSEAVTAANAHLLPKNDSMPEKRNKIQAKIDFKSKLQSKLSGGQFRWLNEKLYTSKSKDAFEMFSDDPTLFDVYHQGFQSQVKSWPQNPIDIMIDYLNARPADLVVADMGCGEAKIAQNVKQKMHSFDLVAQNNFITACDMSKVPLGHEEVDVVIFCLSLMGKNIIDFLKEANRILKQGGVLKIAEVISRFEDIEKFVQDICKLGFRFVSKDASNKMFILIEFEKTRKVKSNTPVKIYLKPCIYKRR